MTKSHYVTVLFLRLVLSFINQPLVLAESAYSGAGIP